MTDGEGDYHQPNQSRNKPSQSVDDQHKNTH